MSKYFTCRPSPVAARSTSSNDCFVPGCVELPNIATRDSRGTASLRSSSCFPLKPGESVDNPVILPPGRARLNEARTDWIIIKSHYNRNRKIRLLQSACDCRTCREDDIHFKPRQFSRQCNERSIFPSAQRSSMIMFFPSM